MSSMQQLKHLPVNRLQPIMMATASKPRPPLDMLMTNSYDVKYRDSVAYLGGGTGRCPPLWPEHKIFLNTLNQIFFLNFWGGGTAPSPDPFFSGEGTPPPHTPPHWRLRRLEPRVFGSAPLHKILNTPL